MVRLAAVLAAVMVIAFLSAPPQLRVAAPGAATLPNPQFLRTVGRFEQMLTATTYWLRLINVSGDPRSSQEGLLIYELGDLVTSIDPDFYLVYWYTALNVPTQRDRGWLNAELSSRLLEKGLKAFPDNSKLMLYLAQNELLYVGNREKAAKLLAQLARRPDVPAFVAPLASRIMAHEGDFDAALVFVRQMRANAHDDEERETYERREKEIVLEQRLTQIDAAVAKFKARNGITPTLLSQLVAEGDLPSVPEDPMGGQLFLGDDGLSHSSAARARLQLFDDPQSPMNFQPPAQ